MSGMRYTYPVRLKPDESGRLIVHFLDLPEALTDGADETEALTEAADCLSEALAGRVNRHENIPTPSPLRRGLYAVEPEPTIALKVALYEALRARRMTVAHLARILGVAEREAARLLDPRIHTRLATLETALSALGYQIGIEIRERGLA